MSERKLIAQYGFLLTGPLATAWNIPGKIPAPLPGRLERCGVPKGAIWTVGDSAEERKMIQDLGRKLVGDGNDPEVVERIEAELAAEATQAAFIKEMDADRHRVYKLAQETKSSLQTATAELAKAQTAASAKLEEALAAWYRFEPSGMRRETQAIIEKAVRLYLTNPDKHSFAKIAADFNVTPKTVSVWFKKFEKETGYRVVTHRRHESVRDRLKREQSRTLPPKGTIAHHTAGNW